MNQQQQQITPLFSNGQQQQQQQQVRFEFSNQLSISGHITQLQVSHEMRTTINVPAMTQEAPTNQSSAPITSTQTTFQHFIQQQPGTSHGGGEKGPSVTLPRNRMPSVIIPSEDDDDDDEKFWELTPMYLRPEKFRENKPRRIDSSSSDSEDDTLRGTRARPGRLRF